MSAELIAAIAAQEERLVFDGFDANRALEVGLDIRGRVAALGKAAVVDVRFWDRRLFWFAMPGTTMNTEDWVRRFAEFAEPMDDAGDAFVPCRDAELAVALELDEDLLDRKLAALRAQATQTAGLEAAVGADRYRASIAGEYFRPAATLFDGS